MYILQFQFILTRKILMLSNATNQPNLIDRRTWLHVPSGTPWSTSSVFISLIKFIHTPVDYMNNIFTPKFHFLSDHTICPFWIGKTIVHAHYMAHHLVWKWGSSSTTAPLDSVGTDLVASFETFPSDSDSRFRSCNPHTSQILCFPLTFTLLFLGKNDFSQCQFYA